MAKVERLPVANKQNPEVHPAADIFPMLDEEALQELAEDIKANGLVTPILLSKDGRLIDGRNRLRACQIAGVAPVFQTFEGDNIEALVISANINRRHLNKSQRAMALALVYPDPERGRGKEDPAKAEAEKGDLKSSFTIRRVQFARFVQRTLPDLCEAVLSGVLPLNEAVEKARQHRKSTETNEGKRAELQKDAPDLLDLVTEERMTLDEAYGALLARREEAIREEKRVQERKREVTKNMHTLLAALYWRGGKDSGPARHWLEDVDKELWPKGTQVELDAVTLKRSIEALKHLLTLIEGDRK